MHYTLLCLFMPCYAFFQNRPNSAFMRYYALIHSVETKPLFHLHPKHVARGVLYVAVNQCELGHLITTPSSHHPITPSPNFSVQCVRRRWPHHTTQPLLLTSRIRPLCFPPALLPPPPAVKNVRKSRSDLLRTSKFQVSSFLAFWFGKWGNGEWSEMGCVGCVCQNLHWAAEASYRRLLGPGKWSRFFGFMKVCEIYYWGRCEACSYFECLWCV